MPASRFGIVVASLCLLLAPLSGCLNAIDSDLQTVEYVDVNRYVGKWYEIASYPTSFQRDCTGTTAEYSLKDDGTIRVFNRCLLGSLDGDENTIEGSARVVDSTTNAKLAVRFFAFFEAPYWIIELDEEYQWAVVSDPARRFLWILSRTPTMDSAVYEDILARVSAKGLDPTKLRRTTQPAR